MRRLIILCMALLGWSSVALDCIGEIPNHAETLVAYAPLLAIPQLVTCYGSWEKDKKKTVYFGSIGVDRFVCRRSFIVFAPICLG